MSQPVLLHTWLYWLLPTSHQLAAAADLLAAIDTDTGILGAQRAPDGSLRALEAVRCRGLVGVCLQGSTCRDLGHWDDSRAGECGAPEEDVVATQVS